jgi:hypothetical protein
MERARALGFSEEWVPFVVLRPYEIDLKFVTEDGDVTELGYSLCELLSEYEDPYSFEAISKVTWLEIGVFNGYANIKGTVDKSQAVRDVISYFQAKNSQRIDLMVALFKKQNFIPEQWQVERAIERLHMNNRLEKYKKKEAF